MVETIRNVECKVTLTVDTNKCTYIETYNLPEEINDETYGVLMTEMFEKVVREYYERWS